MERQRSERPPYPHRAGGRPRGRIVRQVTPAARGAGGHEVVAEPNDANEACGGGRRRRRGCVVSAAWRSLHELGRLEGTHSLCGSSWYGSSRDIVLSDLCGGLRRGPV